MNFKLVAALAGLCAAQSFAIIGLGVQYAPNFGTSLDDSKEASVYSNSTTGENVTYAHKSFSGMQGVGLKLWVDILPIFDIEATYNLQWASYDASLYVRDTDGKLQREQPVELEFNGVPFGKATPKFVAMNGDLSLTYPITSIPIIRPYIGGGITYYLSTPMLSDKFVKKFMDKTGTALLQASAGGTIDDATSKELSNELSSMLQDEGLNTAIGGHIILGVRAKLPVIPFAIYVNGKYYFGGNYDDEIDAGHIVLEAGAGLAL